MTIADLVREALEKDPGLIAHELRVTGCRAREDGNSDLLRWCLERIREICSSHPELNEELCTNGLT